MYKFLYFTMMVLATLTSCTRNENLSSAKPEDIHLHGELLTRLNKNFDRLESDIYRPDEVFHSRLCDSWPGDCEGRLVLGLVCDARATGREPLYLDTILDHYTGFMNEDGYFGPMYDGKLDEQQISGNGWVLRGLCEYYEWKSDDRVLKMIKDIVNNFFLKAKERYEEYPITPDMRGDNEGGVIGSTAEKTGNWILTSDIGSVFIGMEGLTHAYSIIGGEELKGVIDLLIRKFLETDLSAIKAQTHASLTACRGVLRYANLTGDRKLVAEIQKRWDVYREFGMTPGYQNFNWFCREDAWCEPCAIVDSYMLATQLWQMTGCKEYLDEAELIYYNGLCHTQIDNGGFACFTCPSVKTGRTDLSMHTSEAYWCCSMRGGEGLGCAQKYSFFTRGKELYVANYRSCTYDTGKFAMEVTTSYPFEGKVVFHITKNENAVHEMRFNIPVNSSDFRIALNGNQPETNVEGGFCRLSEKFKAGDEISVSFEMPLLTVDDGETTRYFRGPLMLGKANPEDELQPIYHLMDSTVSAAYDYRRVVLFPSEK